MAVVGLLKGRDVYLFPDLFKDGKAFELFSNKGKELSKLLPGTRFEVSDLLETLAPNKLKECGADIADVLIKQDWRKFRTPEIGQSTSKPSPKSKKGKNSEASKQTNILQQVQLS